MLKRSARNNDSLLNHDLPCWWIMKLTDPEIIALITIREMVKYRRLPIDYLIHSALMSSGVNNIRGSDYDIGLDRTRNTLRELKQKRLAYEIEVIDYGYKDIHFRITDKAIELIKQYSIPDGVALVTAPVVIPPLYTKKKRHSSRPPRKRLNGALSRRFGARN